MAKAYQSCTEDYDDLDMNPYAPPEPPAWKVYFDGNFWGHESGQRAGKELPLAAQFDWAGHHWLIPAAYACAKGLVLDFCMRIEPDDIRTFMKKWDLSIENESQKQFSQEERMQLNRDNPLSLEFRAALCLNGKEQKSSHGCGTTYNPCLPEGYVAELEAKWAAEHYGLDTDFGWMILRSCYPWATKRKPTIKTLSVTMMQQKLPIAGPHFRVNAPGDTFSFIYPDGGTEYTLRVQEYEAQTLDTDLMPQNMEYPTHFRAMIYTLTPEPPEDMVSLADCAEGDRPRQRQTEAFAPAARNDAAAIGIIGGAVGPTAIICGRAQQGKLRVACSALHFAPVEDVEWRIVFREKQFEDAVFEISVPK